MHSPETAPKLRNYARRPVHEFVYGENIPTEIAELTKVYQTAVTMLGSKGAIPTIFTPDDLAPSLVSQEMQDGSGIYQRKEFQKQRNGYDVKGNTSACGREFITTLSVTKGDTKVTFHSYNNADFYDSDDSITVFKAGLDDEGKTTFIPYDGVNLGYQKIRMCDQNSVATYEELDTTNNAYDENISDRVSTVLTVAESFLAGAMA